jgi:FkbM family methyltransferase
MLRAESKPWMKQYPSALLLAIFGIAMLVLRSRGPSSVVTALTDQPSQESLELEFKRWVDSFKAPDPAYQTFCENALRYQQGNGQYQQDMYLFFNIFKYWPLMGRRGYFVDSGTNEPLEMSNSLFYEKCLEWDGLCVEPQVKYHEKTEKSRSCYLHKGCLASRSMIATMEGEDGIAKVIETTINDTISGTDNNPRAVQCSKLKDILASRGQSSIDFWSLDVEGAEIDVLTSFEFNDIPVTALLIEDFWVPQRDLDYLVTSKGFVKYRQLAVDSLYIAKSTKFLSPVWEPPNLHGDWMYNRNFRDTVRDKLPQC